MYKTFLLLIICCMLYFISGCDKGIEPEPEKSPESEIIGFRGKVTFTGNWPAGITRTHIVVFKNEIKSVDDFSFQNLAFVVDSIPYKSQEFIYNSVMNNFFSFTLADGTYKYIVVAQSKTPSISLNRDDWFIVGVYYNNGDKSKPGTMTLQKGKITTGIDVNVDFNNPPPQPPK
ncbi:MAG: hypothetical protein WC879_14350 [Melioribacteraceae bacterium]